MEGGVIAPDLSAYTQKNAVEDGHVRTRELLPSKFPQHLP